MQQKKLNFKLWLFGTMLVAAGAFAAQAAYSAGIQQRQAGDPILDGGPAGPCDPQTASADYVGGVDTSGHPVAAADLPRAPIPAIGDITVPLKTGKGRAPAYVQVDGKKVDALVNPRPNCPTR